MFTIFIDNEEVVCESNFIINEEFMNPSSIELNKVFPKSWKGTNKLLTEYYYPEDYSKCTIYKDNILYFSGIVKNSADMELNPFKPHYCSVQVLDPSTLLSEGETLEFVISNKTITEAINQVILSIGQYGFVAGNINIPDDSIIGAYSTLDKTAYDVFNYLSMISGTRWGTRMIDENMTAIDFYSPELLDDKGTISCDKDYFKQNKIQELTYDYTTSDYRNKQIINSDEVYSDIDYNENSYSNGYSTSYTTSNKIGILKSIKVDGIEKTFTTKENQELGIEADFYYTSNSNTFESSEIYNAGTTITIEYTPLVKGRQIVFNNAEVNRINNKTGRKGVISRYETRSDILSSAELNKVAESYIKFKGIAEININIISRSDFLILGGKYNFESPVSRLNGNYLVKTKKTNVYQNDSVLNISYEYELTNSFDTENELNYFDNQRAKSNGNIQSGESITRNIDLENEIKILFNNFTYEEIALETDNVLNCILESPFTS